MYSWNIYEYQNDIQIVPEGEDEIHFFGFNCSCHPQISKRIWDEKLIITHNSHAGVEVFEKAELNTQIYHPLPKYTKDC